MKYKGSRDQTQIQGETRSFVPINAIVNQGWTHCDFIAIHISTLELPRDLSHRQLCGHNLNYFTLPDGE